MAIQITPRSARYIQSNRAAASAVEPFVMTPISEERANAIRNAPAAQPTETSSVPPDSPFYDHAKTILTPVPLDQDTKADVWEIFHSARDSKDLMARLNTINAPDDVKAALVTAKKLSDPVPTATDRVVEAVYRLAAMDKMLLEIAEAHPTVLKSFLAAGKSNV